MISKVLNTLDTHPAYGDPTNVYTLETRVSHRSSFFVHLLTVTVMFINTVRWLVTWDYKRMNIDFHPIVLGKMFVNNYGSIKQAFMTSSFPGFLQDWLAKLLNKWSDIKNNFKFKLFKLKHMAADRRQERNHWSNAVHDKSNVRPWEQLLCNKWSYAWKWPCRFQISRHSRSSIYLI